MWSQRVSRILFSEGWKEEDTDRDQSTGDKLLVALIEPRPLIRHSLVSLLDRSAPTDRRADDLVVFAFSSPSELLTDHADTCVRLKLLLLSIGAACVKESGVLKNIELLRQRLSRVPLVILADSDKSCNVLDAFRLGARGYIPTDLDSAVAVQALQLVIAGGTFVPLDLILQGAEGESIGGYPNGTVLDKDRGSSPSVEVLQLLGHIKANHIRQLSEEAPSRGIPPDDKLSLTPRQLEVLQLLQQGNPNKIIADQLKVQESTVKVHVREILRKLKVKNRTHAALLASHLID